MSSARPSAPARDTGLPPGVRVGPLGRRLAAYVIDSVVPAVAALLVSSGAHDGGNGTSAALVVVGVLLGLAWALVCWQQLAVKAATPGLRLLKLQVVGFLDGRPVGWSRALLRWLVFAALTVTGLGLLLLIASILMSPRYQGWQDRVATAVLIVERPLAPRTPRTPSARTAVSSADRQDQAPAPAADQAPSPASEPELASASADAAGAGAGRGMPVAVPAAVAGDPAIGPELAPLAGQPVPAPGPTPAPEPVSASASAADTAVVAPVGRRTILDGWVAELDDGREVAVRGLVLLGRNPQPGEGEVDAELVKLPDESRTVSKTHLALGVDDAGLFVVDRGSTNGSTITPPDEATVPVVPFHAVSVSEGSVVSIGDHWVRIRRDGR